MRFRQRIKEYIIKERFFVLRATVIAIFLYLAVWAIWLNFAYPSGSQWFLVNNRFGQLIASGLISVAPELAGIVIGVFTIDYLNEYRQEQQLKKQLILQLGSKHNDVVYTAVSILKVNGWLYDGSLIKAYLENANLSDIILDNSILSTANLNGADLSGASLSQANLTGAQLRDSNLSSTNLIGASLGAVNMQNTNLNNANLSNVTFAQANLAHADLTNAILDGANLFLAKLQNANLVNSKLPNTNLYRAKLTDANLSGADLYGANLEGAQLTGAYLGGANLSHANLKNADLYNAHLAVFKVGEDDSKAFIWGRSMPQVVLKNAKYNAQTKWPKAFDPVAAGAVLVKD